MDKVQDVLDGFWDLFNKRIWLDGQGMKAALAGYTPSEIHGIEYIATHPGANLTQMAAAFSMTRGAISKLAKKLAGKGLAESYQKPGNKKEVFFRLTPQGEAVHKIHMELHSEYKKRDEPVLRQVSDEQVENMMAFIALYGRHLDAEIEKTGAAETAGYYDRL